MNYRAFPSYRRKTPYESRWEIFKDKIYTIKLYDASYLSNQNISGNNKQW